ncbi:MAG: hypothetical protein WA581_00475 [Candidatus Acidiferrales bacterium]
MTEALVRYFEARTAPEGKMESVAVFVLAKLLAAIVADRDDAEEIALTVYDRILSENQRAAATVLPGSASALAETRPASGG